MKHIYLLYGTALLLLLGSACTEKEEKLTPTGYERDWTVITEPTNGNRVDQLRYEIYRDFGVSTYYNDTIGREERTDILETPYTYYEILKVFYNPGGVKPVAYRALLDDPEAVFSTLEYFKDYFLSFFEHPEKLRPYLFVDSILTTPQEFAKKSLFHYQGYNTEAFRVDSRFDTFSDEEKKTYFKRFVMWQCSGKMMSGNEIEWSNAFIQLTKNVAHDAYAYSSDTTSAFAKSIQQACTGTKLTTKEELGFIVSYFVLKSGKIFEAVPTPRLDMDSYIWETLHYNEEEFNARYPNFPLIQEKCKVIREKLKEMGVRTAE